MKHVYKGLFAATLVISSATQAAVISGQWKGKEYSLNMSDTFKSIEGTWGKTKFNVEVNPSLNSLGGTVDGKKLDLRFSATFPELEGTLPCGPIKLSYTSTEVEGTLCKDKIKVRIDGGTQGKNLVWNVIMESLLADFPLPTRGQAQDFIKSRIKFL